MSEKIAIIGAGGTGYSVAAELSLRGFEVWLCDILGDGGNGEDTLWDVPIHLDGAIKGETVIRAISADVQAVLAGAKRVICCTVSNYDERVARAIVPYLEQDALVLLSAGNLGSYLYWQVFHEYGLTNVVVGETSGNLFSCRKRGPNSVFFGGLYRPQRAAAFPAKGTEKLCSAFEGLYQLLPVSCILESAFSAPNLLSHIALTIVNAGAIETCPGTYYIFKQGICRSTINLADGLWQEKKLVMDALGFDCAPSPSANFRKYADPSIHSFDYFKELEGPDSLTGRHITEDIPILGGLFLSVAQAVGVQTPLYHALVEVASAINQTNYYAQGRTLHNLGLGKLSGVQVPRYFQQAEDAPDFSHPVY